MIFCCKISFVPKLYQNCTKIVPKFWFLVKTSIVRKNCITILNSFTPTAGIRVSIHNSFEIPFPENNGINVETGLKTTLQIRQNSILRTKLPFDGKNCTNSFLNDSDIFYNGKYTFQMCTFTCLQRSLRDNCGCIGKYFNIKFESKFWSKIENLVKNRKFGQKPKIWSKIEILVKDRNFGHKSKFWSKTRKYGQKSKIWSKIQILVTNRKFVKNRKFGQKSKIWSKNEILSKIEIWPKIEILGQNL
mgnify:CR=1 FL=1